MPMTAMRIFGRPTPPPVASPTRTKATRARPRAPVARIASGFQTRVGDLGHLEFGTVEGGGSRLGWGSHVLGIHTPEPRLERSELGSQDMLLDLAHCVVGQAVDPANSLRVLEAS